MSIISVTASCEGTLSVTPSLMLIDTSDTLAQVMSIGYLNGQTINPCGFLVPGQIFVNNQPALVTTSDAGTVIMIITIDGSSNVNLLLANQRVQSSASRSLNSGFQINTLRDALVNYSVDISCTMSLTSGQTGTVFLEIASDSGFTTDLQELGRVVNGNTGTLTLGLDLTQNATGTLSGFVPSGYYCRLRTDNTVSTPIFTYRSGQEVLL